MVRTFEERVGQELDVLFQAALFLHAGSRADAERHLVGALCRAFPDDPAADVAAPGAVDFGRWLEGRLLSDFYHSMSDESLGVHGGTFEGRPPHQPDPTSKSPSNPASGAELERLGSSELHWAASAVCPPARAALWLVLVRRWSYAQARELLGITSRRLHELLSERDLLMRELSSTDTRPVGRSRRSAPSPENEGVG